MEGPDVGDRERDRSRAEQSGSRARPADESSDRSPGAGSGSRIATDDAITIEDGLVRWVRETDQRSVAVCRDVATSGTIVLIIGLLLFGVSGTWPPLVAVESGSMEPNIQQADLVVIVDEGRFAGDGSVDGTGIVTLETGRENGYEKFDTPGDVIVFAPDGDPTVTPVIHRAHFWVEDGENWVQTKAELGSLNGATCDDIASCPAPHDGFVTKGDANRGYDQLPRSGANTTVVSPDWVTGKAMFRLPWLGQIRLAFDSVQILTGVGSGTVVVTTGALALALFAAAAAGERRS